MERVGMKNYWYRSAKKKNLKTRRKAKFYFQCFIRVFIKFTHILRLWIHIRKFASNDACRHTKAHSCNVLNRSSVRKHVCRQDSISFIITSWKKKHCIRFIDYNSLRALCSNIFPRPIAPCYRAAHAKCRLSSSGFECNNCRLFPVVARVIGRLAWTRLRYRKRAWRDTRSSEVLRCCRSNANRRNRLFPGLTDVSSHTQGVRYRLHATCPVRGFRLLRYRYRHVNAQAFMTAGAQ